MCQVDWRAEARALSDQAAFPFQGRGRTTLLVTEAPSPNPIPLEGDGQGEGHWRHPSGEVVLNQLQEIGFVINPQDMDAIHRLAPFQGRCVMCGQSGFWRRTDIERHRRA